jgi:hypothetical protein
MHKDNEIVELNDWEIELINEFKNEDMIAKPFFPLTTYDMVQVEYPYPDHGVMVARSSAGTDINNKLMEGSGMWCKVEDIKKLLNEKDNIKTL